MTANLPDFEFVSDLWGIPLQPASCPNCEVAHLIPPQTDKTLCPACYKAPLEYQPSVIRSEPPELYLDFSITPAQIRENLRQWLKNVWLHPKELNPQVLSQRLTRTFIPLWLVDGKVFGNWQARMGFDYQVVSSQEIYQRGGWTTREQTETRIRWESRAGKIERGYHNLSIPALEEHNRLIKNLGNYSFKKVHAYSPDSIEGAAIRIPSLLPDAAWSIAKSGFDRLAAKSCQTASEAQHVDEFLIDAEYREQNWTQLLLPAYTTVYRDENGRVYPIFIHGQTGKIVGVKRASQQQARNWSIGLVGIAIFLFVIGLLFAAGTILMPLLGLVSFVFFACALLIGIISPIPAIWAWNFNRSDDKI